MTRFRGYGQFCPVAMAAEVIAERWTPLVLRELLYGHTRFNELKNGVPLMSPTLLSQRLKQLQSANLVSRKRAAGGAGWEYRLTESGRQLQPIIEAMGSWGLKWLQHDMPKRNYDVAVLMWDMRRGVKPEEFPPAARTVIQFAFADQSAAKRFWWLVCETGEVDLCIKDPGFEIDLRVDTDARTLTDVWMGVLPLDGALRAESIRLEGPRPQTAAFRRWFALNKLANMPAWPWPSPAPKIAA